MRKEVDPETLEKRKQICNLMKYCRKRANMSQKEVMEAGDISSQRIISYIENGTVSPTIDSMIRYFNALGIDIAGVMEHIKWE